MQLAVFGATGGTGHTLVVQALAAGHNVTTFVRRREALGDMIASVHAVEGDVFDPSQVIEAVRGRDAVLSCLGTRPWRHQHVCSGGVRAIIGAMKQTGVRRIIAISSQGVGDSKLGPFGRIGAAMFLRRSFDDKAEMERELEASGLDWVVVRPGILGGTAKGQWRADDSGSLTSGKIARADLAAFMLRQLTSNEWLHRRPVLVT